jgi:peptidoglycan/LPS O-acetylase OafA/YrhL
LEYRAEIDGLRALAVVPVILFHAGFEQFSGGFIGVDVFFVISGYLITTILVEDIENNRFSLVNFYERRARRILPVLFFVVLVCIPFAWMWMLPRQLQDFSQSLVAVSVFASNMLFWLESGYFEAAAEAKPLLHTWSLAVEEQYYLIFPIFLLLSWRFGKNSVFCMIVVFWFISFLLSEWGWRNYETANFFLLPTRAWEIFAGSIAAFIVQRKGVQKSNALSFLGLAAIIFSIFAFDELTPFPSVFALVPVLGTVLLVIYADRNTLAAKLLSTKVFVGIGLISYSAYLWHQPLFAFYRVVSLEAPSTLIMLTLSGCSLLLAYLSWLYIETPFRNKSIFSKKLIFVSSALFMALLVSLGLIGNYFYKSLASGQFNPLNEISGAVENKNLQQESWGLLRQVSGDIEYGNYNNPYDLEDWVDKSNNKRRLLVVGNSHSKDLYNVLVHSEGAVEQFEIARYGARLRNISKSERFWRSPNYIQADVVIISHRFKNDERVYIEDLEELENVVERIQKDGKAVAIVENIFEFPEYRSGTLNLIDVLKYSPGAGPELINREYHKLFLEGATSELVKSINVRLNKIGNSHNILILDRMEYICESGIGYCYAVDDKLNKLFYDYGHHSIGGAAFFGKRVDDINWLKDLIALEYSK